MFHLCATSPPVPLLPDSPPHGAWSRTYLQCSSSLGMHVTRAHLDALCDAVDAVVNQLGVNSHEAIDGLVRRVDRAWGAAGQAAKQGGCRAGCATLCTLWVVLGQGSGDKPAGRQVGRATVGESSHAPTCADTHTDAGDTIRPLELHRAGGHAHGAAHHLGTAVATAGCVSGVCVAGMLLAAIQMLHMPCNP